MIAPTPIFLPALRAWLKAHGLVSGCPHCFGFAWTTCDGCRGSGRESCACRCGACSHSVPCDDCNGTGRRDANCCPACERDAPQVYVEVLHSRLETHLVASLAGLRTPIRTNPPKLPDTLWLSRSLGDTEIFACATRKPPTHGGRTAPLVVLPFRVVAPKPWPVLVYPHQQQILPVFLRRGVAA